MFAFLSEFFLWTNYSRRKKLDTSKLVCFLLVGSGLLITQECIYLMRLCIKSN